MTRNSALTFLIWAVLAACSADEHQASAQRAGPSSQAPSVEANSPSAAAAPVPAGTPQATAPPVTAGGETAHAAPSGAPEPLGPPEPSGSPAPEREPSPPPATPLLAEAQLADPSTVLRYRYETNLPSVACDSYSYRPALAQIRCEGQAPRSITLVPYAQALFLAAARALRVQTLPACDDDPGLERYERFTLDAGEPLNVGIFRAGAWTCLNGSRRVLVADPTGEGAGPALITALLTAFATPVATAEP